VSRAAVAAAMSFRVDPWDPAYGSALEAELEPSRGDDVVLDLEVPAGEWRPIGPNPSSRPPSVVLFVDGVRRVEARVWIDEPDGQVVPGICASYAAGVVACDGAARVVDVDVQRGLFTSAPAGVDIETRHGPFALKRVRAGDPKALTLALQDRMSQVEIQVAQRVRDAGDLVDDLLVVDGPLRGRPSLERTVGMIKTHNVEYLPPLQNRVVGRLAAGKRTPVFFIGGNWSRHSWYLCLPGGEDAPWAGVVRCEATADLSVPAIVALADVSAAVLPRFASERYKEPRAPQNLYPIAGLERELRRRLGDEALMYRALRAASRVPAR
jgi:hypothetical protein